MAPAARDPLGRAIPGCPDVVEDADTFAGNARKKAAEVARSIGCWVLADDSGLSVDTLGGAPGFFRARYAGLPSDDSANNTKLLAAMLEIAGPNRARRFTVRWRLLTRRERFAWRARESAAAA